ncbi:uncharacterized protein LOC141898917 [Tubulanus polymorphus]|uniref:uncharacterized protein LOC141898917 n=1 Tax=Tubulanus polymorphus TaxID=672921 RepID=UPI003DA69B8C
MGDDYINADTATLLSYDEDIDDFLNEEVGGKMSDPNNNDSEVDDSWIDDIASDMGQNEQLGDKINEKLAGILNKLATKRLTDDAIKALWAKYLRPENLNVQNPRVNQTIWYKLKHFTKKRDLRLSQVGEKISNTLNAQQAELINDLSDLKAKDPELFGSNLGDKVKELNDAAIMGRKLSNLEILTNNLISMAGSRPRISLDVFRKRQAACTVPASEDAPSEAKRHREEKERPTIEACRFNQTSWKSFIGATLKKGETLAKNFQAGSLKNHYAYWNSLSTDHNILEMIRGCRIEFDKTPPPVPEREPYRFNKEKSLRIDSEIIKMITKRIIEEVAPTKDQFVSNIFTREKADYSLRVILDLTELNEYITYHHFKMESLKTAISLMSPGCYMASMDWKDAYYSVPINRYYRKYLRFRWRDKLYQFACLPNGLASAPRFFTKLTEVLFSQARRDGHLCSSFIDDSILVNLTLDLCRETVVYMVNSSELAGFIVHWLKSVLNPTQILIYLGFILNSLEMTVRLTPEKLEKCFSTRLRLPTQERTGGTWSNVEAKDHINVLELKAVFMALRSFSRETKDNSTTVSYISNQGGRKQGCNEIAREIWLWCYKHNNWLTVTHLPGINNVEADKLSRSIDDNMEWKLNPKLFQKIRQKFGEMEIDLFASRHNFQLQTYIAWKPDPYAEYIDAFSEDWASWFFYAFPPFNLVGKVLQKVMSDQASGVLVVPF